MKTADLRKYRKNAEALEALERLLSGKIVTDTVQGSHGAPDYALGNRRIEGLDPGSGTISLLAEKARLQREQAAIRAFINGIKVRRIYEALYFYCIADDMQNPSWEDVSARLGEESSKALEMAVARYLSDEIVKF